MGWVRLALVFAVAACGGDDGPAGGERDGGMADAGTERDGGGPPGDTGPPGTCRSDDACSDGVYCNGEETCAPADPAADDRGCLPAAAPPDCSDGIVCTFDECDEDRADCSHVAPDADGDGHGDAACVDASGTPAGDDCDDADSLRFPGNAETCDGHDEDCNPDTFGFVDADMDGAASNACCNDDNCGSDCNDADGTIRPGIADGPPAACDTIDNDCDGAADEGCPCVEGLSRDCGAPEALMRIGECRPGTQFCVGGMWTEACAGEVRAAPEACNARDDDCDGMSDEGVTRRYYVDGDGDGYGLPDDPATPATSACSAPSGYAPNPDDCDDTAAAVSPEGTEVCNSRDDDCDGTRDEGVLRTFFRDGDGDGFGDRTMPAMACDPPPMHVAIGTDCNDASAASHPAAVEVCDTIDNDCDGSTDEGLLRTFYRDGDGDGWGTAATTMMTCSAPIGFVDRPGDCDDTTNVRSPSQPERCEMAMVDEDCDGASNEGCACTDGATRMCGTTDVGACEYGSQTCIGGTWSGCAGDVAATTESCNGVDDDCDGTTDEMLTVNCYADGDSDGAGAGAATTLCRDPARMAAGFCPAGWTTTSGDCNDANASIRPGATETCNGIDDDCDTMRDEGTTVAGCYADGDADGYGTGAATTTCSTPGRPGNCAVGYVNVTGDCNDASSMVRPMATELCNGIDDDCDAMVDDGVTVSGCYVDADGDTYGAPGASTQCRDASRMAAGFCPAGFYNRAGDCNDANAAVRPGTTEVCNGSDDDCDAAADETFACVQGASGIGCGTACGTPGTRTCSMTCTLGACTAATETCNGCDDDGDGTRDEGFTCVQSSVDPMPCTTGCGTTGSRRCRADCSGYEACRAATETCNGCDDDLDGAVDNGPGMACARDSITACITACGTLGTRDCPGCVAGTCRAATESCNYCDDDVDGIVEDEAVVASDIEVGAVEGCGQEQTAGTAVCTTPGLPLTPRITLVDGTLTASGAAWARTPITLGYGTYVVEVENTAVRTGGQPADGWAVVIAGDVNAVPPFTPPALVGGHSDALGVPYTRRGISVEWRFNRPPCCGDETDWITLRGLDGTGTGYVIGEAAAPSTARLDSAGASSVRQRLVVEITPRNDALSRRMHVTVRTDRYGPALISFEDDGFTLPGWRAQQPLWIGTTAATGGLTHRSVINIGLFSDTFRYEAGGVCMRDYGLRIAGGGMSGRLEIWHGGQWGTICDDAFSNDSAAAACRQLGFSGGTFIGNNAGTGPVWFDDVICPPGATSILACPHTQVGFHNCVHGEDVAVTCTP